MLNKKFKLKPEEIKILINTNMGCLATDRITVDGCKVGFMYKEKPSDSYPDTGWRFFAGDESKEYKSNSSNTEVYQLNTICNYDPDIIPFLDSDYGTAYYRDTEGKFQLDRNWEKQ